MSSNSKIVQFIEYCEENNHEWLPEFEKQYPSIKVSIDGSLAIFNYSIGANFNDPIVQESRGIIIDTLSKRVVCWPFRKFGKTNEYYADKIDWDTAVAQEKIDGSIVKLWFNNITDKWQFSTNSIINAINAPIGDGLTFPNNFLFLIQEAKNYREIDFDNLSKDITYIFELVSPYNRVVIPYEKTELYHIGTRNNITGEELDIDIGIQKPRRYVDDLYMSPANMVRLADDFNKDEGRFVCCECEGFVVVDQFFNRVKAKSRIYTVLHNLKTGSKRSKNELLAMLYEGEIDVSSICSKFPEEAHIIKYYDYALSEFLFDVKNSINFARQLYKSSGNDRKYVSSLISDNKYSHIMFAAISHPNYTWENVLWRGNWFEFTSESERSKIFDKYIETYHNTQTDKLQWMSKVEGVVKD